MFTLASEGKGWWIPEGWAIPIFLVSLACAALLVWIVRKQGW
jgi:hypothetical protein